MLPHRVVCCSHRSDRRIRVCISTNQSVVFVLWFEKCSNFNEVMGDSERAVRKMELSFRMRNDGFSVFMYFTALKEKCDTTAEQMKDIRLSILNVLLML